MKKLNTKGEAGISIIILLVLFVVIMLPILGQIVERYRINIIKEDTTTSVELALKSTLVALNINEASAEKYDFKSDEFNRIFKEFLAFNMKLNKDLSVTEKSLVDGDVNINHINYYGSEKLPYTNIYTGKTYNRPYFNVELLLIIKPSLLRKIMQNITGIESFQYTYVHDISMPLND